MNQDYDLDYRIAHEKDVRYQIVQQETNLQEKYQNNDINEIRVYFRKYEIKILMNKIYDLVHTNQEKNKNFTSEWKGLEQNLLQLLKENHKEQQLQLKIISLLKQFLGKKFNEKQITPEVENWQRLRLQPLQILKIFEEYNLNNLIQIPEIIDVVAQIIYNNKELTKYDFYNLIFRSLIQQELNKELKQQDSEIESDESIFQSLELKAISFINNHNNIQNNDFHLNQQQFQVDQLLHHKHIIDFFIARHFNRNLSMLSEDQSNELRNEIDIFIAIKNKSKIGQLNFQLEEFIGTIGYLKEKYQFSESQQIRLIKMIQASAFISDFEQEAGNAMTMLSHIQAIIINQDFTKINLKNSSMSNIQFFRSNFNLSKLTNVSIVSTQFIECKLQNVSWRSLESSCLNIFKGSRNSIFSQHTSILIMCDYHSTVNFWNVHTDKKVKFFCKQFPTYYVTKQSLKLSCQGSVLLYNDRKRTIFWSIQCNKKIRINDRKILHTENKISPNGEVLAYVQISQITFWKIYQKKQNLILPSMKVQQTQFSKNSKIFIIIVFENRKILFQNIFDNEELQIISFQQKPAFKLLYKFSPECSHYALYESQQLSITNIKDRNDIKTLNQKIENIHYLKLSPKAQFLAFGNQKQIFLWQINNSKQFQSLYTFFHSYPQQIRFSLDSQLLVFKNNNNVILWQINSGLVFHVLKGHSNEIHQIRLSTNGQHLITSDGRGNSTRLWNIENYSKWQTTQNPSLNIPETLNISRCGLKVGFVYDNKTVEIRNLKDLRVIHRLEFDQDAVRLRVLSDDCAMFAYSTSDNSICVQRIEDRQTLILQKYEQKIQQIKFSPNGQYLALVIVFFVKNMQKIRKQQKPTSYCNLWIFRIEDWKEIKIIREFNKDQTFEFSQFRQEIAVCLLFQIKIMNLINQHKDKILIEQEFIDSKNEDKNDQSSVVAFSSNGKYLASDSQNHTIRIWKIDDQIVVQRLIGNGGKISKIAFLDDEMILVSASSDCSIRIWNIQNGEQIEQLKLHQYEIINLAFSFDRQIMISSDNKGKVILWKVEINNLASNEKQQNFIPYYTLGNSTFSDQCQFNGSQFTSSEGYNLLSLFI